MSHALREQLAQSVSAAHKVADAVTDKLRGNAPVTPEDDRIAAEEFDRSRGLDRLTRAERSMRLREHSAGAPIVMVTRRSRES